MLEPAYLVLLLHMDARAPVLGITMTRTDSLVTAVHGHHGIFCSTSNLALLKRLAQAGHGRDKALISSQKRLGRLGQGQGPASQGHLSYLRPLVSLLISIQCLQAVSFALAMLYPGSS